MLHRKYATSIRTSTGIKLVSTNEANGELVLSHYLATHSFFKAIFKV